MFLLGLSFIILNSYCTRRAKYELINNERGAYSVEFAIIIPYLAGPSRILVVVKTHRKLLLSKSEKTKREENKIKQVEKRAVSD